MPSPMPAPAQQNSDEAESSVAAKSEESKFNTNVAAFKPSKSA